MLTATSITFLSPLGALLALGALVPLVAVLLARRRANRVRGVVGLARPRVRRVIVPLAAVVLTGTLLGAAAAQPVLERTSTRNVRTDAEVFFVLDVSRSMLAQSGRGSRDAPRTGEDRGPGPADARSPTSPSGSRR